MAVNSSLVILAAICEMNKRGPKCVCPEECVKFDSPVCGSDDKVYPNECELNVQACRRQAVIVVVSQGECSKLKHRLQLRTISICF